MYTVYTKGDCRYCVRAKVALRGRGLPFEELDADAHGPAMQAAVRAATGGPATTVPQIFHNGAYVGGYTELAAYLQNKENGK